MADVASPSPRQWTLDTILRVATDTGRIYASVEVLSGPKPEGETAVVAREDVRAALQGEREQTRGHDPAFAVLDRVEARLGFPSERRD